MYSFDRPSRRRVYDHRLVSLKQNTKFFSVDTYIMNKHQRATIKIRHANYVSAFCHGFKLVSEWNRLDAYDSLPTSPARFPPFRAVRRTLVCTTLSFDLLIINLSLNVLATRSKRHKTVEKRFQARSRSIRTAWTSFWRYLSRPTVPTYGQVAYARVSRNAYIFCNSRCERKKKIRVLRARFN